VNLCSPAIQIFRELAQNSHHNNWLQPRAAILGSADGNEGGEEILIDTFGTDDVSPSYLALKLRGYGAWIARGSEVPACEKWPHTQT
jgi:hypothetical protein